MSNEKIEELLKAILHELRAIESQLIITRYEDDILKAAMSIANEENNEALLLDFQNRLNFIKTTDKGVFDKMYSVWESNQNMKKLDLLREAIALKIKEAERQEDLATEEEIEENDKIDDNSNSTV